MMHAHQNSKRDIYVCLCRLSQIDKTWKHQQRQAISYKIIGKRGNVDMKIFSWSTFFLNSREEWQDHEHYAQCSPASKAPKQSLASITRWEHPSPPPEISGETVGDAAVSQLSNFGWTAKKHIDMHPLVCCLQCTLTSGMFSRSTSKENASYIDADAYSDLSRFGVWSKRQNLIENKIPIKWYTFQSTHIL